MSANLDYSQVSQQELVRDFLEQISPEAMELMDISHYNLIKLLQNTPCSTPYVEVLKGLITWKQYQSCDYIVEEMLWAVWRAANHAGEGARAQELRIELLNWVFEPKRRSVSCPIIKRLREFEIPRLPEAKSL